MATETKTPLGQVMNGRGWMRPACTCLKPLKRPGFRGGSVIWNRLRREPVLQRS